MLRFRQPFEEGHGGLLPLWRRADGAKARAPLHHQFFPVFKHRTGAGYDGDLLGCIVRVGHDVAVIEDTGRGSHADNAVAGAERRGGVAALKPDAPLQSCLSQRFPRLLKSGAEGQFVPLEKNLAQGFCPHLEVVEVVVVDEHGLGVARNIRRLGVCPGCVNLCRLEKPLPGVEILYCYPRRLREAVEDGLVDEHDLGGLRHRKDDQAVVYRPLFQKSREERRQLFLGEVVPIVHENAVIGQRHHRFGVGDKEVRQFRSPRLFIGGREHQLMDGVGIGHRCNLDVDFLLFSHRLVKLLDEVVEGRICLPAIDVPDRNGGGHFLFLGSRTACKAKERHHGQQQRSHFQNFHTTSPDFIKLSAASGRYGTMAPWTSFIIHAAALLIYPYAVNSPLKCRQLCQQIGQGAVIKDKVIGQRRVFCFHCHLAHHGLLRPH